MPFVDFQAASQDHQYTADDCRYQDGYPQGGDEHDPFSDAILETSEQMRSGMDYFAHGGNTRSVLERLASLEPRILACMHGSAYSGDGSAMLRQLADRLGA